MKTKKTTITYADRSGNPCAVLCPGHVAARTFNKAFGNEWSEPGNYTNNDLKYEYWIVTERKFKKVTPETLNAKKFTVTFWD